MKTHKTPKGWRKLRPGEEVRTGDKFSLFPIYPLWLKCRTTVGIILSKDDIQEGFVAIRKINPKKK